METKHWSGTVGGRRWSNDNSDGDEDGGPADRGEPTKGPDNPVWRVLVTDAPFETNPSERNRKSTQKRNWTGTSFAQSHPLCPHPFLQHHDPCPSLGPPTETAATEHRVSPFVWAIPSVCLNRCRCSTEPQNIDAACAVSVSLRDTTQCDVQFCYRKANGTRCKSGSVFVATNRPLRYRQTERWANTPKHCFNRISLLTFPEYSPQPSVNSCKQQRTVKQHVAGDCWMC